MSIRLASIACVPFLLLVAAAPRPSAAAGELGACGAPATRVHEIQGAGSSSPHNGRRGVVVEGVVVGDFQGFPDGLGGFFLQEDDADADSDPATSEGIFVFDSPSDVAVEAGDRVRVRGDVREFFGLTELSPVSEVIVCPPRGPASPARIRLPVADLEEWERWEGMRVRLDQKLVATGHRNLARFGEIDLAVRARTWSATHREAPGDPARALRDQNARHRILLDDGSDGVDPEAVPYLDRPKGRTLRLGDSLKHLDGVLDFAFGRFRIHPTRRVRFRAGERRPESPPGVAGTLRLVVWNVGNHFNGDGRGGGFPTRGPRSPAELERQRTKLVATLVRLDPDVAVLVELENDGAGPDSALAQLAEALNRHTPGAPYAPIQTGEPRLGRHAIAVGILHRPSTAAPVHTDVVHFVFA